jgi:DHA1 family bicyclomycin/chloramphenicol resistance-like MFS transporter
MPARAKGDPGPRPEIGTVRLTLILASFTAFGPFAIDMYLASFPLLAKTYDADLGAVQLGLSAFFLGLTIGQVLYGPLIDRFGRKGPLLAGIALFTVASLLITMAPTIESFVALRLVQAIGGAAGMIVSRTIIADLFPEQEAARVLSTMMMVQAVAPIVAPVLGGYLTAAAGWRSIFLFLGVFGLACFIAAKWLLPETLPAARRQSVEIGRLLRAWADLITKRDFIVPTLAGSIDFACLFAFISGSPFVYMELHHVSARDYGWLIGVNALSLIVAAPLNRFLVAHFSPQTVLSAALVNLALLSVVLVALAGWASLPILMLLLWICFVNLPLVVANAVAITMAASGNHRGSGSGILGLLQFGIGSAVSVLVGLLHNGTVYPMVGTISFCAVAAALVWGAGRLTSQ